MYENLWRKIVYMVQKETKHGEPNAGDLVLYFINDAGSNHM